MPRIAIPDGHTRKQAVHPLLVRNPDTRKYDPDTTKPAVTITYRPATTVAVIEYDEAGEREKSFASYAPDHLAKHLVSWDLEDIDGNAVPVTEEAVRTKLPMPYLTAMIRVVNGHAAELSHLGKDTPASP